MYKTVAAMAVASLFMGSSAGAVQIAGWDFGQYIGPGAASTDGVSLATTVAANYSDFDPSFGAGAESASQGTMRLDGTVGSTLMTGVQLVPTAGSLTSNIAWPQNNVPNPDVQFDGASVQDAEFPARVAPHQVVSVISGGAINAVFEANLSVAQGTGSAFLIDFAARTTSGSNTIEVAWSTDGSTYTVTDTFNITTTDTAFQSAAPGALSGNVIFARLGFGGAEVVLDNVGIGGDVTVPEPTSTALMMLGLAGLARAGRRK